MQKYIWWIYGAIVTVSLATAFFAPTSEAFKGIALLPASGAMLSALWQLLRDQISHERTIEAQQKQDVFNLGATSPMAGIVFDKHVEFCEKYLEELHKTVVTLTREGPTQQALEHAGRLYSLRIQYTAWLTPEMEEKLDPFERALRSIGANSGLVDALSQDKIVNDPEAEKQRQAQRTSAIQEMYETFKSLMDFEDVAVKDEDATVKAVKTKIREILQMTELVKIRTHLINKCHDSLDS